jgi:hypothetical protein
MTDSRRSFLEKSATLAALGFLPRQISPEEWLEERERSRRATPANFKGKPCVISAANGYTDHPTGIKLAYDKVVAGEDTLDAIIAGVNCVELAE